MLTLQRAKGILVSRFAAAAALSLVTAASGSAAWADGMALGGCIGGGSLNCVVRWGETGNPYIRVVPQPVTDDEKAQSAQRDRKWEQRCQPTIVQDRYGVARYRYAAPGCEFGVIR